MSLRLPTLIIWGLLVLAAPASAFIAPDELGGDVVQAMLRADVLPRFAACEARNQHVYGIESVDTFEDPAVPRMRYWVFRIVLTLCGQEALVAFGTPECQFVEQELRFVAWPGLAPRAIYVSPFRLWPAD